MPDQAEEKLLRERCQPAGIDLRQVAGLDSDLAIVPDASGLEAADAQVAVDFTHIEAARANLAWCAANGVDGMKLVAYPPHIMSALLDEARKLGLGSTAHLEQRGVAQMDALTAAKMGLGTVTHFYGHFEPLMRDYRVQPWPEGMNYNDEQYRFGQVARLWNLIHPPGSDEWKAYYSAISKNILRKQSHDGSWQEGHVGPVYTTAINATILQLENGFLPIYQK